MKATREMISAAATVAVYLVRFIQLGSVVIAGFGVCYLVWMHNHHYCSWYGCNGVRLDPTSVPVGEVLFIIASILVTLEWMLFGGSLAFQARTGKSSLVDTFTQFAFACFTLFVYSIGLVAFVSIPTVRATWPYCYNIWDNRVFEPPEKYFCILTQTAVTCGLISWIMTMLVALLNLVEFRKDSGIGGIRLGDDTQLPTESDAVLIQDRVVNESS
ncbi:hypothetical protein B0T10DRAFT_567302 [Thelonectria olida]|uniref:Uncharacterized protein n=1 Tax=Thelonectria olida TaxID=1576542 RepID=A0A9P8VRF4_9HYPO|nr:hypothetical protein B0T10DRAFT_567302 [Thelonectria olida]